MMLKSDLQNNAVVAWSFCLVSWTVQRDYDKFTVYMHHVMGMMLPYFVVAVLNILIVIQMAKYRHHCADMPANVESAQR